MQGNEKIIERLNARLADELTAVNQYMVHAEMCDNWGYEHLHEAIQKRAIEEMKHAERLIGRILFLEGRPTVSKLNKIEIGPDVEKMHKNDRKAEETAIRDYNADIGLCVELGDNGTRELFESILVDEERHIDRLEAQQPVLAAKHHAPDLRVRILQGEVHVAGGVMLEIGQLAFHPDGRKAVFQNSLNLGGERADGIDVAARR